MPEMTESQLNDLIAKAVESAMGAAAPPTPKIEPKTIIAPSEMRAELKRANKDEVGLGFGRVMRCLIGGGGSVAGAIDFSKNVLGDGDDSLIQKLLIVGDDPSGGFIVPDEVSNIFIDLLEPYAVLRGMGVTTLPMTSGNLSINGGSSGPTAFYIGETDPIPVSTAKFRRINLSAKKLVGMVPISNDLIRTSSPAADKIVAMWLFQVMANREDLAFIRGDGTANTPTGLRNLAGLVTSMTGTGTIAEVAKDLSSLKLYMRQANLQMTNPGYLMSPRTEDFLWLLQDPITGWYPYREGIDQGKLGPYPYGVTTQIPEDLGAGSDESELYFCNFNDVVIGDTFKVKMDVSTEASYEEGGVTRSAFQNDLTLLRTIAEHDINVLHVEAITVLSELTWGA